MLDSVLLHERSLEHIHFSEFFFSLRECFCNTNCSNTDLNYTFPGLRGNRPGFRGTRYLVNRLKEFYGGSYVEGDRFRDWGGPRALSHIHADTR
jgi:hypothetical protein